MKLKANKVVLFPVICCVMLCMATAFMQPSFGEDAATLYKIHCSGCHGADGTNGKWGARNLQESSMDEASIFLQIVNGKKLMPSFRKKLSEEKISLIAGYTKAMQHK